LPGGLHSVAPVVKRFYLHTSSTDLAESVHVAGPAGDVVVVVVDVVDVVVVLVVVDVELVEVLVVSSSVKVELEVEVVVLVLAVVVVSASVEVEGEVGVLVLAVVVVEVEVLLLVLPVRQYAFLSACVLPAMAWPQPHPVARQDPAPRTAQFLPAGRSHT